MTDARTPPNRRSVAADRIEVGDLQERDAAWAAFLALRGSGWRFNKEGQFDREVLHSRKAPKW